MFAERGGGGRDGNINFTLVSKNKIDKGIIPENVVDFYRDSERRFARE